MKNTRQIIPILIASTLLGALGCSSESVDSEDVRTSGIWAKIDVDGRSDGRSRVVVELNVGGEFGTNVELSNNEYLEVEAAGVTKRMTEDTDFLDIDYQAYMDTTASETEFKIRFYRTDGENIVGSMGILANSFEITAPLVTSNFGLNETVNLVWTPEVQGGSIRFYSTISCTASDGGSTLSSESVYIDDTGIYDFDISLASLFQNGTTGLNTAQPCEMSFTLERESFGNIDLAFEEGGFFKLTQTREVENITLNID